MLFVEFSLYVRNSLNESLIIIIIIIVTNRLHVDMNHAQNKVWYQVPYGWMP